MDAGEVLYSLKLQVFLLNGLSVERLILSHSAQTCGQSNVACYLKFGPKTSDFRLRVSWHRGCS